MTIRKRKKKNTLGCTIDAIGEYIRANHLQEGSPLPTEIELSRQLGVSRSILREALQHFRTLGIITAKSRTGAHLNRLFPENPFESYHPFLLSQPGIPKKVVQFRGIIETGVADLIVKSATATTLRMLRAHNDKLRDAKVFTTRIKEDDLFHVTMLQCVQNPFVDCIVPLFTDCFLQIMHVMDEQHVPTPLEVVVREHDEIISCIKHKDTDGLRRLLYHHNEANVAFFDTLERQSTPPQK